MHLLGKLGRGARDAWLFGPGYAWKKASGSRDRMKVRVGGTEMFVRVNDSDVETIRQIFIDREYDLKRLSPAAWKTIERRYRSLLDAGKTPVILDMGANIGIAGLFFAALFPEATIVSIEPEDGNFEMLGLNARQCERIHPLKAAVGSQAGFVAVRTFDRISYGTTTARAEAGCSVVTVDQALATVNNGALFLAKIDIEGFEDDLFTTNVGWLDRVDVVIIEPHDWMFPGRRSSRNFQAEMGRRDFDLFPSGENLVYVRNTEDVPQAA